MCKKQTSVSHSSTETEINSLDAGLRMDGIPAHDLWDLVTGVFHSSLNQKKKSKGRVQGDLLHDTPSNKHTHNQTKTPIQHYNLEVSNVDHVSSNEKPSGSSASLFVFEECFDRINLDPKIQNQICRHRTPTPRHVDKGQFHT